MQLGNRICQRQTVEYLSDDCLDVGKSIVILWQCAVTHRRKIRAESWPQREIMTSMPRLRGPAAICGLLVAVTFGVQTSASGQDRPKPDEFQQFDRFKQGSDPIGNTPDEFFDKFAKYYVGRLNDSAIQKDGMSQMIQEFGLRALPLTTPYPRLNPDTKKFVDRFGKAMIANWSRWL